MPFGFEGQVIAVTGAGRGLGRAYAIELAKLGARVVVNDLDVELAGDSVEKPSAATSVCEEIRAAGGEAVPNYDSVATAEGGAGIVETAMSTWGRLDGLVNNAGIMRSRAFHNMYAEDFDAVVNVHLFGAFHVTRAAWPVFRKQEYGRVVFVSSSVGLYGAFGGANYGSAKAGMLGLMNVLNVEGERFNIKANCIAPVAATRMSAHVRQRPEYTDEELEQEGPQFVAPVVAYLLSPECGDAGLCVEAGPRFVRNAYISYVPGIEHDPAQGPLDIADVATNWEAIKAGTPLDSR